MPSLVPSAAFGRLAPTCRTGAKSKADGIVSVTVIGKLVLPGSTPAPN